MCPKYTECGKTPCPNFEVRGGTKTKIYCQATICQTCVLAVPQTVEVGLTKFGNQANHLSILKKSRILYQFREDVSTYGHQSWYKADNSAAEIDKCAQKCQITAASAIQRWRSYSESTGDIQIKALMWPNKKSIGVRSVNWKAKPQDRPVQSSNCCNGKWQWDVFGPDVPSEPQPRYAHGIF
jgi:hypothetical protein